MQNTFGGMNLQNNILHINQPLLIVVVVGCLNLFSCNTTVQNVSSSSYKEKISEFEYKFIGDNSDTISLEKAIRINDTALTLFSKYSDRLFFSYKKVILLQEIGDYSGAIKTIDTLNKNYYIFRPWHYTDILRERLLAMKAQKDNDLALRNEHVANIVSLTKKCIEENKDSILVLKRQKSSSAILKNNFFIPVAQYYFYKSFIEEKEKVRKEMLADFDNFRGCSSDFKNLLEEWSFSNSDLMHYEGY